MEREWFASWFDSPYYHKLYQYRDEAEAESFLEHLLRYLEPSPGAKMLDVACGQGRYARFLAEKGHEVAGLDISSANIRKALEDSENIPRLDFLQHDMRDPIPLKGAFDYAFNFFTSFGYFETREEHIRSLRNISRILKEGGVFVLDFMNVEKCLKNLKPYEEKSVDQAVFKIRREYDGECIVKKIKIRHGSKAMQFEEKVVAFRLQDFEAMFETAGLEIREVFGNYQLDTFHPGTSDRLILLATKMEE